MLPRMRRYGCGDASLLWCSPCPLQPCLRRSAAGGTRTLGYGALALHPRMAGKHRLPAVPSRYATSTAAACVPTVCADSCRAVACWLCQAPQPSENETAKEKKARVAKAKKDQIAKTKADKAKKNTNADGTKKKGLFARMSDAKDTVMTKFKDVKDKVFSKKVNPLVLKDGSTVHYEMMLTASATCVLPCLHGFWVCPSLPHATRRLHVWIV